MHEASLMKNLMGKVEDLSTDHGGARIARLSVWLGALSHMSPEHFMEHFNAVAPGTCAEGADVECEASDDISHPQALDVVLLSVDVEKP